ncbi:MAG TPA: hypothetical protein VD929_02470 [Caulobacteraceae bacterium]|nr:hypothetical protein [Caulobacteraceae bacterium]
MTLPVYSPEGMSLLLLAHVAGGTGGIVFGYAAVFLRKGAPMHRACGALFVLSMLIMGLFGAIIGTLRDQPGNIFAGVFVAYLVLTAWAAARRGDGEVGRLETAAMAVAFGMAGLGFWGGVSGSGSAAGPTGSYVFGVVALLAALTDLKVVRRGGLAGTARISRHLWRMCAALFMATGSFFLGQMDEIPAALRGPHLWVLALAPLALLAFWMIRVRLGRSRNPVPAVA